MTNGDFKVAQRGTTFATAATGTMVSDRWSPLASTNPNQNIGYTRSTDAPKGFKYSTKLAVSTAISSLASTDYYIFRHRGFEQQDIEHLNFGTADAKEITLSFWVKSNKTGTMFAEWQMPTSSASIELGKPYTIDVANTWEYKTITYPANTVHTSNAADNAGGLYLYMWIAAGATYAGGTLNTSWNNNSNRVTGITNYLDSTSNEIYFTGFQLEVGDTATEFEHRSYVEELALCSRYYQNSFDEGNTPGASTAYGNGIHVLSWSDGNAQGIPFQVPMRTAPTMTFRPEASNTTGVVSSAGTNRSATATRVGTKQVSYIAVASGTASTYVRFTWEANAEL
tara:strand:- start:153 stop:1169 length:1017 start_codon:yes stop_codon:yes gene_type:complete